MATVEQTMMKVQRILTGPMNLRLQLQGNSVVVSFSDVSTQVRVTVRDWGTTSDGDPRTLVQVDAPILWSVEPTHELFEWVAREGANYLFGHVMVLDDTNDAGKVFLLMSHTLLGDYLDEAELASALWGVLSTADDLDDKLQARFGGKRLVDQ